MVDKAIIELAVKLNDHPASGITLGLGMSEIVIERLGVKQENIGL